MVSPRPWAQARKWRTARRVVTPREQIQRDQDPCARGAGAASAVATVARGGGRATARTALGKPADDRRGVVNPGQRLKQRVELSSDLTVSAGEQVGDAFGEHTAEAALVAVDLTATTTVPADPPSCLVATSQADLGLIATGAAWQTDGRLDHPGIDAGHSCGDPGQEPPMDVFDGLGIPAHDRSGRRIMLRRTGGAVRPDRSAVLRTSELTTRTSISSLGRQSRMLPFSRRPALRRSTSHSAWPQTSSSRIPRCRECNSAHF